MVRWRKVWADVWSDTTRTLLAALSITVGVFAAGLIAGTFLVVQQDMQADFWPTNPHTAQIFCQNIDAELLPALRRTPGVLAVDARYNLWVRIVGRDGQQYAINLQSIETLADLPVDKLEFQQGNPRLGFKEIYLERQGAQGLGLPPGVRAEIVLNNGATRLLTVAGTVHDVQANPFTFTSRTAGYVTPRTMEWLGESRAFNMVSIVTAGSPTDVVHIRTIAERVAATIEQSGRMVYSVNITNPGRHPAQSIIETVLGLMGVLGVLSALLSAFLIVNTVNALIGRQTRQIGVMKAIGARTGQLILMYLAQVLIFGILALLIAAPLAALATAGLSRWMIGMLNADALPFVMPPAAFGVQALIALAVPLAAALMPVLNGMRLTVRRAISPYDARTYTTHTMLDRVLESRRWLPRPILIALRQTFSRKGRLAFTLLTLALGGAMFMAIMNVRESLSVEIEQTMETIQADVNVEFPEPFSLPRARIVAKQIPGVVAVEGWNMQRVNVMRADGQNSDQILLYAAPSASALVQPNIMQGRWLLPNDANAIVLTTAFQRLRPDVQIGDRIVLRVGEREYPFVLVGLFRIAGDFPTPLAFVNNHDWQRRTGIGNTVTSLRIITEAHDAGFQAGVQQALREQFAAHGIQATMQIGREAIDQAHGRMNILIVLLLCMAVLIATVGGLGLAGALSMNVLERTREIGVLRSIGASNAVVFQMVALEGVLIGAISWVLALPFAVPLTQMLNERLGLALMHVPLFFRFAGVGVLIWLVLVLVLAATASLLPAWNAVRLTIREVLAYE